MSYRVLVTGSRTWDDWQAIWEALDGIAWGPHRSLTVVHGACPDGADRHAAEWCADMAAHLEASARHLVEEPHPADWRWHGRAAGPIRNAQMVQAGADLCLAFIRNGSKGATHCADLAERAGIPTKRWTA